MQLRKIEFRMNIWDSLAAVGVPVVSVLNDAIPLRQHTIAFPFIFREGHKGAHRMSIMQSHLGSTTDIADGLLIFRRF